MASFIFWSILLTHSKEQIGESYMCVDVSGPAKRMWYQTEDKIMTAST